MTKTVKAQLEEKTEDIRARVADGLEAAADSVRSTAKEGMSAVNDLADQAGKKLDSTAKRVRSVGWPNALGGLRRNINRHPVRSLMAAAAVGLVAGVTLRR